MRWLFENRSVCRHPQVRPSARRPSQKHYDRDQPQWWSLRDEQKSATGVRWEVVEDRYADTFDWSRRDV